MIQQAWVCLLCCLPGAGVFNFVRALAEAHQGYEQLALVCEMTNDQEKLYHYMRALTGATASL